MLFIKVICASNIKGQNVLQELLQETAVPDPPWHPDNPEATVSQFL